MPCVSIDVDVMNLLEILAKDDEMDIEQFINQVLRDYLAGLGMLPRILPR